MVAWTRAASSTRRVISVEPADVLGAAAAAGERNRAPLELDYYQRLLDRF